MFKTSNVWLLLGFCLLSKDTDFTASTDSPNRGFLEDYYFCHDHHTTSRLLVNVLVEVIKQNTVKTFFTSDFGCIGKTDVSTFSIGVQLSAFAQFQFPIQRYMIRNDKTGFLSARYHAM